LAEAHLMFRANCRLHRKVVRDEIHVVARS
jgi:hypothetical protein